MVDQQAAVKCVFRQDNYVNEKGEHLVERVMVSGAWPEGLVKFASSVQLQIQFPQGVMSREIAFQIPDADTLDAAFEKLPAAAKAAEEAAVRKLQSGPRILPAGAIPPRLLNGRIAGGS